ncbi:hypothetical protein K438DRAFT_1594081 [Mycena galopus ATCC 62051]|nr:hypothetical protein K438DRAFT_1594081 [Mycena galopus ATCC 62051]
MALWQQTFGDIFESDGRLQGTEDVQTVQCVTTARTCSVKVPAPGFALVFLSAAAQTEDQGTPSKTFATMVMTTKKSRNTATIAVSVLATSNGHGVQRIP